MQTMTRWLLVLCLLWVGAAQALTREEALGIAAGDNDARVEALAKAVAQGDEKTAAYLQALADDAVKIVGGRVLVLHPASAMNAVAANALLKTLEEPPGDVRLLLTCGDPECSRRR